MLHIAYIHICWHRWIFIRNLRLLTFVVKNCLYAAGQEIHLYWLTVRGGGGGTDVGAGGLWQYFSHRCSYDSAVIPIPSRLIPIHDLIYSSQMHFIVYHLLLGLSSCRCKKKYIYISLSRRCEVCPIHLALLDMVTLTFWGMRKLRNFLLYNFVRRPVISHLHSVHAGFKRQQSAFSPWSYVLISCTEQQTERHL